MIDTFPIPEEVERLSFAYIKGEIMERLDPFIGSAIDHSIEDVINHAVKSVLIHIAMYHSHRDIRFMAKNLSFKAVLYGSSLELTPANDLTRKLCEKYTIN